MTKPQKRISAREAIGKNLKLCWQCSGSGQTWTIIKGYQQVPIVCPACNGRGRLPDKVTQ